MNLRVAIVASLSLSRIAVSPLIVLYSMEKEWLIAYILLITAYSTDYFDGWLADKIEGRSKYGHIFDSAGDLFLTLGAMFGIFCAGVLPWNYLFWMALLALPLWSVIILTPRTNTINKFCYGINAVYNTLAMICFVVIYTFKAFGGLAKPIVLLYVPVAVYALYTKRHRIVQWFS